MDTINIPEFNIIGIAVRTTNENDQAGHDIAALWKQFFGDQIPEKIPNKTDDDILCVYTDYEKDHTKPYTTILGCRVSTLNTIPEGMTGKTIAAASYKKFTACGNLEKEIVFDEWNKIWNTNLSRAYTSDIELYGKKAQNPEHAEVDIFIALK